MQAAQLSGFVLEQMKSAKHAMRNQCDLDLAAGVLDLCLHLLQFGFTQDQRVIEQIFEHAVGIISVPQHQRLDKAGRQDATDEQFIKALRLGPNPTPTPNPTPHPHPDPDPNPNPNPNPTQASTSESLSGVLRDRVSGLATENAALKERLAP